MKGITKGVYYQEGRSIYILHETGRFVKGEKELCNEFYATVYPDYANGKTYEQAEEVAKVFATAGNLTNAGYNIEAMPQLVEALDEARLQIEYFHQKFTETGSGNKVLSIISEALKSAKHE